MLCFSGIPLSSGLKVPCGQCINCRINKSRKWATRILLEHYYAPKPRGVYDWFLTLTYDEKHVPWTPDGKHRDLDKLGFRQWLNNVQKRTCKFRYFAVGEYGTRRQRPHYHLVGFSLTIDQVRSVLARWKKCDPERKDASLLSPKRAAYIAQYSAKKLRRDHTGSMPNGLSPEFRTSSLVPPIGSACLPPLLHSYRRGAGAKIVAERGDVERTIRLSGQVYPLDQYILRKLREALGIPLTHHERAKAHPHYLRFHNAQEAEKCPDQADQARRKNAQEKKLKESITRSVD